ncbi:MAG: hypothetical protein QE263_05425 [Vampirovibrionales bacterium]|nr:hypothetical protein [Vampirovibrionales bacterium]
MSIGGTVPVKGQAWSNTVITGTNINPVITGTAGNTVITGTVGNANENALYTGYTDNLIAVRQKADQNKDGKLTPTELQAAKENVAAIKSSLPAYLKPLVSQILNTFSQRFNWFAKKGEAPSVGITDLGIQTRAKADGDPFSMSQSDYNKP